MTVLTFEMVETKREKESVQCAGKCREAQPPSLGSERDGSAVLPVHTPAWPQHLTRSGLNDDDRGGPGQGRPLPARSVSRQRVALAA